MDELGAHNRGRWEELARNGVRFSRPWLDLDPELARRRVDAEGMLGEVSGKDVLCLAGGGGQQSAAFALLGARVTVRDFSETQLDRDLEAAAHYGVEVRTVPGDMRDLSMFSDASFDLVWHAHSLSFVPDRERVFDEVARVLRPGGLYRLSWTNPFVHGVWDEEWTDRGHPLSMRYEDRAEIFYVEPSWTVARPDGTEARIQGPREFRHSLGPVLTDLLGLGFRLLGFREDASGDLDAEPGSWKHFKAIAPPWLIAWWRLEP